MGSLFQLRDFWFTSFPEEEFSSTAMTVGNVDNTGGDKIVVGSFQGHLRIISPSQERGEMQASDVLFEKKFDEPILQVECGPFEPVCDGVTENLLAVLFPRRLSLLRILRVGDAQRSGDGALDEFYYNCSPAFETTFDHSAYNFVSGNFGNAYYKMLCVQSLDGFLTFVDFNKVLYQRVLPPNQFLSPGPLAYCASKDCFLTCNSSMFLLCYGSYAYAAMGAGGTESVGKLSPTWAYNLGEDAVSIVSCNLQRGLREETIVVLCGYKLHVLDSKGSVITNRRLNAEAISMCFYKLPEVDYHNVVVGFLDSSISIFSDVTLEWSAKVSSGIPQCLTVNGFCGVEGMIVLLNADGRLSVSYLGTDPAEGTIIALESKAELYGDMCSELRKIDDELKETGDALQPMANIGAASRAPATSVADPAKEPPAPAAAAAAAAAPPPPPPPPAADGLELEFVNSSSIPSGDKLIVSLLVKLSNATLLGVLRGVEVYFRATEPIHCETEYKQIPHIEPGETVTIPVTVLCSDDKDHIVPSSLEVTAVALFKNTKTNEHVTSNASMIAPLSLVAKAVNPVKNPNFSIQINTDKSPAPSLVDLFPDMTAIGPVAPNVLSLEYVNGADVTILASKNAARFKIQGSTMEGLWLVSDELMRRLKTYYCEPNLVFTLPDDVPYADFCAVIETHVAVRKELQDANEEMEKAAVFSVRYRNDSFPTSVIATHRKWIPSKSYFVKVTSTSSVALTLLSAPDQGSVRPAPCSTAAPAFSACGCYCKIEKRSPPQMTLTR
ncbi:hypothetical protein AGDE_08266 [Angomonas deanei]|uniref:PTHB1 N-terminus/PTHB1 C-terminus, putative n=1 Tax=Angomonas deanei TaxID=59799 RepID=A0A7G2CA43_9TRYP|nr:hypothetical protein AGDE_08266 [Angomonas deanei]CAD2216315.1 PTHB1 N-terminus/PTHB1 C-terminus, putative [Angomonas deanei]|eukprot:EPY33473.1 hypothetical protein AGDE_08266 [Angomonas deanei]